MCDGVAVHDDEVGLELFDPGQGLRAVARFPDDLELALLVEPLTQQETSVFTVVHHENFHVHPFAASLRVVIGATGPRLNGRGPVS